MITFRQINEILNSGQPFTCRVVSYDRTRKTGGDVNDYEAVLMLAEQLEESQQRPLTEAERRRAEIELGVPARKTGRDPQHKFYHTRNIRLLTNGQPTGIIKKIHLPLIVEFNGETVTP